MNEAWVGGLIAALVSVAITWSRTGGISPFGLLDAAVVGLATAIGIVVVSRRRRKP